MNGFKNSKLLSLLLAFILGAFVVVTIVFAQKYSSDEYEDSTGHEGKTVFVDVSAFGRKNHAAKRMTKMHQEFALDGWTVVDVMLYTENSDLEGFFVTYVKK